MNAYISVPCYYCGELTIVYMLPSKPNTDVLEISVPFQLLHSDFRFFLCLPIPHT